MTPPVSPYPVPELAEFLRQFRPYFYRCESTHVLERYIAGLLADIEHKSGARVAGAVAGLSESALYRLLIHTDWDAAALNRQRLAVLVGQAVAGDGMLVFDEVSFPRQGPKTVGVAHQYCGILGKNANCQVAVIATYADPYFAWPVLGQLYLPQAWCQDRQRRQAARIPDAIPFQTKPEIALALLDQARAAGVPFALVGADAGYGDNPNFLDGIDRRTLGCVVGVACDFGVRRLDEVGQAADRPLPTKRKQGRPRTHPHPVQVAPLHRADAVITSLPEEAWQTITWRQGSEGPLTKQFVALRVRRSQDDRTGPEGWLIGERPLPSHAGDRKFYWSNLPADTPLARLAELAHRRPSIERFHQDSKGQTGLGDYAARLWHSFHRQLTIGMLAISWLALQRSKPKEMPIVVEPLPVTTPEEPVFPLRSGTVQQCRNSAPPSLPVPVRGTGTLASADRADQLITTRRQTPLARRRSLCQHGYLTINATQ